MDDELLAECRVRLENRSVRWIEEVNISLPELLGLIVAEQERRATK